MAFTLIALTSLALLTPALGREWTREGGTAMKFQAELRGIDGPNVMLMAPDGRTAAFPLAQFSSADRQFVAARLSGLVLDAMPALNAAQKAGAGWGKPLSADPADCVVAEISGGFHSKHFSFRCAEKLTAATMRDLAEACEVVHEVFRVAPWGVLATPKHDGRFEIHLLPQSEIDKERNIFDSEGVLRIPLGAAGLQQISSEWVRDESPGAGKHLKEYTAYMLLRDVIGLVPPWLPDALADCIAEIPTVGGTAWCAEVPAGLRELAKVSEVETTPLTLLLIPPPGVKLGNLRRDQLPLDAVRPLSPTNPLGPKVDDAEIERKRQQRHAQLAAHYFTRLADGRRAQQLTKVLRQAMEDRPKWDAFDVANKKYHADWEELKKLPGAEKNADGSYRFPAGTHVPDAPKPPHEYENGDQLPWLLLPQLLEQKTAADVAAEIAAKIATE